MKDECVHHFAFITHYSSLPSNRYNPPMSLRVYNSLTHQKELFEPVRPGNVGMYLCGPTVYKSPHIGHMVGPVINQPGLRVPAAARGGVRWPRRPPAATPSYRPRATRWSAPARPCSTCRKRRATGAATCSPIRRSNRTTSCCSCGCIRRMQPAGSRPPGSASRRQRAPSSDAN